MGMNDGGLSSLNAAMHRMSQTNQQFMDQMRHSQQVNMDRTMRDAAVNTARGVEQLRRMDQYAAIRSQQQRDAEAWRDGKVVPLSGTIMAIPTVVALIVLAVVFWPFSSSPPHPVHQIHHAVAHPPQVAPHR